MHEHQSQPIREAAPLARLIGEVPIQVAGSSGDFSRRSNRVRSAFDGVEIRLLLAGVKPNSDAIRIMISACRLAIETYGDWIGYPDGDLTMVPYFWMASVASAQSAYAPQ